MRTLMRSVLALLLAVPMAFAQSDLTFFPVISNYELDATAVTYCVLGSSRDSVTASLPNVKTTGSSVTVDAVSGSPFANVAVTDELTFYPGPDELPILRTVLTRASAAQITVANSVLIGADTVNLSVAAGYPWSYRTLTCGTGVANGWFGVSGFRNKTVFFQVDQLNATGGITFVLQCKGSSPWAQPVPVYPPTGGTGQCGTGVLTTANQCAIAISDDENYSSCRLGMYITTADDGGDLTTNREEVTAYFQGRK